MKTCFPFFHHSLGWYWEGNGSQLIIELWRLRISCHIQPNFGRKKPQRGVDYPLYEIDENGKLRPTEERR